MIEIVVIARRGGKWMLLPMDPGNVDLEILSTVGLKGPRRVLNLKGIVSEEHARAWEEAGADMMKLIGDGQ